MCIAILGIETCIAKHIYILGIIKKGVFDERSLIKDENPEFSRFCVILKECSPNIRTYPSLY